MRNSRLIAAVTVVVIAAVSGWFGYAGRNGPSARLLWQRSISPTSGPAVGADGTVYIGGKYCSLYALNGATGTQKWRYETRGQIDNTPVVGPGGAVYCTSSDLYLYCLNAATGTLNWKFHIGDNSDSAPTFGPNGIVYVASPLNKTVYVLNETTGKVIWTYRSEESVCDTAAGPEGILYVGSMDGTFYALNRASGRVIWKRNGFPPSSALIPVLGNDGSLYAASAVGNVYALSDKTGVQIWKFSTGSPISRPVLGADGTLIFSRASNRLVYPFGGMIGGVVYALSRTTGKVKWKAAMPGHLDRAAPAVGIDGTIYIAYVAPTALSRFFGPVNGIVLYDESLCALDGRTGGVKWTHSLGDNVDGFHIATAQDGTVFTSDDESEDEYVYAIKPHK